MHLPYRRSAAAGIFLAAAAAAAVAAVQALLPAVRWRWRNGERTVPTTTTIRKQL